MMRAYAFAVAAVIAALACGSGRARAADAKSATDLDTVLFAGADIGTSRFLSAGFKRGLGGRVDQTGFIVMGTTGYGTYRDKDASDGIRRDGMVGEAALLAGYQWLGEGPAITLAFGPEVSGQTFDPPKPGKSTQLRYGARMNANLWWEHDGRLLDLSVSLGTANAHVWSRAAYGWRVFDGPYLGPEVGAYMADDYVEGKIGIHLTNVPLGPARLRLSGGWSFTDGGNSGAYVGLSGYWRL